MKHHKSLFRFSILVIILICTWISSNFNWGENRWGRIIRTDGTGYYAYLPALIIYQDPNFGFFDEIASKNYHQNHSYDYRHYYHGYTVNKYFAGTALAILPFFLLAHLFSQIFGYPVDGYSALYLVFVSIAALFYLALGLVSIRRILKFIPGSTEGKIALILVAITFGTNLFYYTVEEPSMSHVYSFGILSAFIWQGFEYFKRPGKARILCLSLLLGLIVLIRPVNGIILLLLPFTANTVKQLQVGTDFAIRNYFTLISAIILLSLIIGIQPVIYKIQTGQFFLYSYGEEGFNFLMPQPFNFLFSYRKGLFVYTPLFLLSLAGGFYLFKESKIRFAILAGFLILLIYILSSWWQWYYGGSFSQRVMIEYYTIPALLLGYFLFQVRSRLLSKIYIAMIAVLIMVNIIQTEQYRIAHIHWSEMNKELYWKTFLRIDKVVKREKPEWQ